MKTKVRNVQIPLNSELSKNIAKAYYFDAYQLGVAHAGRSPLQIWLAHVKQTPNWMNGLMQLRNKMVSLFGLKDLGAFSPLNHKALADYKVGDKVGIFTLESISDTEVVLADNDKHLAVKVSVYLDESPEQHITVSTLVQVHNLLGRVYMLFITPVHRLIVPLLLARFI